MNLYEWLTIAIATIALGFQAIQTFKSDHDSKKDKEGKK